MKRILFIFVIIIFTGSLISCAVQYDITSLKKLTFKKPVHWERIESQDDYTYDYAFRFQNQGGLFEIYLRTLYVPRKSAMAWLRDKQKAKQKQRYETKKIMTFSTKMFNWHLLETEDSISYQGKKVSLKIRQYVAKEDKSPRLIECYVAGTKESFAKLQGDGGVNAFLDSINLEEVKRLSQEENSDDTKNYFTSAEEMALVNRGEKYYNIGRYDQAIMVFQSLLEREPTKKLQADLYYFLSECYMEKGIPVYVSNKDVRDFRESIAYAKKALELERKHWGAHVNIGIAYMNIREYSQAKEPLRKALKYCDKNNPVYPRLRFYYEVLKNPLDYKSSALLTFTHQEKIEGIMYDQEDPFVMISGKPYRPGQTVNEYTILKINNDKIYLKFGHLVDEFFIGNIIPQPVKPSKS
ncbi:MAG: tetratricopeptide repeat protein [Candidatus Omnitrophota bacterium]